MITSCKMSDAEVREAVFRELRLESQLKQANIGVSVREAMVTLTGVVTGTNEMLAAVEAAGRAEGVFAVNNEIVVNPAKRPRTDQDIAKAVRNALEWDSLIPDTRIKVAVSNGWVALQGKVDLVREREEAERVIKYMDGVRGIYNLIDVRPQQTRAENVRDTIGTALKLHAEREAAGIGVSLREGTVSLSGKVHTWAEKQAILGALKYAPGVETVNDQLHIDPYC